ncbi:MAG: D-alanine--D-alanine ligase family protein [Treponema sp.]
MNVTIIYGGKSAEHEISILSASSVVRNIEENINLIGITKEGKWYAQDASMVKTLKKDVNASLKIIENEECRVSVLPGEGRCSFKTPKGVLETDVVFPVLHGSYGEDGTIQGLLEMTFLPYVGPAVMASSIAMDKDKTKILWKEKGLNVVPYIAIKKWEWQAKKEELILLAEKDFKYPLFVKPSKTGSSVGTSKAMDRDALISSCEKAFEWDDKILIEKFITAREIECSVTGNNEATVYTAGEIVPHHEFYDYEAKYIDADGATLKIPADLDDAMYKKIRDIAGKAYEALELSSLSRIDFLLDKLDGTIYLNEVNTIPGFTSISMFPKLCEASGLPYKDLISLLLNLAIERNNARKAYSFSFR